MALTKIPGSLINSGDNLTITDLTVTGNLSVTGTSTTLETATLQVEDKNIVLNYGSGDTSASADGAGITIQDAVDASNDATFNWGASNDRFKLSHGLEVLTGNVGIGTTSPSGKLHVEGATSGANLLIDDGTGYGVYVASQNALNFNYGRNGTTTGYINFRGYQDGATQFRNLNIGNGKEGTVALFDGVNSRLGIGTASPDTTLQVNGSPQMLLHLNRAASTPGIKFTNGSSTSGTYGYMVADENEFGFGYYDGTSSSTKVSFDNSGNVGIGQTSPSATLDVNGSMKVDNIELQDSSVLGIGAVSGAGGSIGHTASVNEGIFWHSANDSYGIYRTSGGWSGNYQQLKATWDTGIILDGGANYGLSGVSFQTNGTERVMIDTNAIRISHTSNTPENAGQPDLGKTTFGGIHFESGSSGSSRGITWEASDGNTQAGYVVHNNGSDGTHHGWFATNTYSGGPYCRMKLTNYGTLILGAATDLTSVTNAATTSSIHVNYGDVYVKASNGGHYVSDLLPGYSRGTFGCFKADGNYIYFTVNGSYVSYINSSGTYATSDERLKENITPLTGSLDKIKQLRGVNFTWKDTEHRDSDTHIGFIAQEVEPHFPEIVGDGGLPNPDDENEESHKNVNYAGLVPALVEAIKELEARVAELEG